MATVELRLTVPLGGRAAESEAACDAFLAPLVAACLEISPGGVAIEGPDAPPGGEVAPPSPGTRRLRIFVEEAGAERGAARLREELAGAPGAGLEVLALEDGWQDRWKAWFRGFDIGSRLRVRPPWEDPAPGDAGRVEIVIEPGLAFGTGHHATTRLCLERVAELAPHLAPGWQALDIGCGTGILAIGALRLGAARAVGLDVDPQALRVARENAELNGVADRLALVDGPVEMLTATYPVVLANILASVLIDLAVPIARSVGHGGKLALAGILVTQAAGVEAAYRAEGLRQVGRAAEEDWVRLDFERPCG